MNKEDPTYRELLVVRGYHTYDELDSLTEEECEELYRDFKKVN